MYLKRSYETLAEAIRTGAAGRNLVPCRIESDCERASNGKMGRVRPVENLTLRQQEVIDLAAEVLRTAKSFRPLY